jgi:hypothetical protein
MKPTNYSPETLEYQVAPDYLDCDDDDITGEDITAAWDRYQEQLRHVERVGIIIGILLGIVIVVTINHL